jgi:hypothetical protein
MVTSKYMNEFEGDLSLLKIDINDDMRYYDGTDITSGRSGAQPVNGLTMFELAKKARERADLLVDAADAMDLRIRLALDKAEVL